MIVLFMAFDLAPCSFRPICLNPRDCSNFRALLVAPSRTSPFELAYYLLLFVSSLFGEFVSTLGFCSGEL
jgi:hypothetical protein